MRLAWLMGVLALPCHLGCGCSDRTPFTPDSDTDTDTDADTDTDVDTDSDTDTDSDSDSDSDTDNACGGCARGEWCQLGPGETPPECVGGCHPDRQCAHRVCCPMGTECADGRNCPLPDLTIDVGYLLETLEFAVEDFEPWACEIEMGCLEEAGSRRLMRFALKTPNIGEGNLHLGDPAENPLFVWWDCDGMFHFSGYAWFRLVDGKGMEVGSGHKQAFCLMDYEPLSEESPPPRYGCDDQGIQAGWSDIYEAYLHCQWIDVTDVAPGDYTLEVELNFERVLAESDFDNNSARIPIRVE